MINITPTQDPFSSLETAIACTSRDMSVDKRDAWVWGIVLGWDDSIDHIAKIHGWTPFDTNRLLQLRSRYKQARELWRKSIDQH